MLSIGVDPGRCTRCRRCEAVCDIVHGGDGQGRRSRVWIRDSGWPPISICRHCEDAPCADACVSGAIRLDPRAGVVEIDVARCVGCWSCVMECPFAAIAMVDVPGLGVRAYKCDGCREWGSPRCVTCCPTGALRAGAEGGQASSWARRQRVARVVPGRATGGTPG